MADTHIHAHTHIDRQSGELLKLAHGGERGKNVVLEDRVMRQEVPTVTTRGSDEQRGRTRLEIISFTVIDDEQCPMACGKVSFTAE